MLPGELLDGDEFGRRPDSAGAPVNTLSGTAEGAVGACRRCAARVRSWSGLLVLAGV